MKKYSKKESCSTEIGGRRKSDNKGNVNLKQLFRRKKFNSPTHTETYEPDNLDIINFYKKLCQKNFCYPSNFRERYPSANYDEVQRKVISNIKVVPNENVTEVLKPKKRNLNRNLKYNNMSHNICKRISEVSFFTTSSERPSCASVKRSLVSCNKDELTSHLSDLYFHDGNYGSLYDSKETVLDNGINGMEIDIKKSDRDLEQLVYFLKEHLGLKYSFEPAQKPIMEFDECSLKASKNSLFSLLFNLSSHSELSSYDHKSAVVQQTVVNNFSSTKTNIGSGSAANSNNSCGECDDSVIVEENQEEISPTSSTESYEVQEIKCEYNTAQSENNQEGQHDKEEEEDSDPVDEKHLDGDSEGSSTGSEQTVDAEASKRSESHMTHSESNDSSGSKDNEGNGKSEENNKDGIEKSQEKKQENEKSEDNDEEHGSEESQENKQENGKGEDNEEEDGNEKGDKDKDQEPAEEAEETDEGKTDSNGETDEDAKSWLESIQETVFSVLSKLNFVRGPTLHDSVMYTYRFIRSAADRSEDN